MRRSILAELYLCHRDGFSQEQVREFARAVEDRLAVGVRSTPHPDFAGNPPGGRLMSPTPPPCNGKPTIADHERTLANLRAEHRRLLAKQIPADYLMEEIADHERTIANLQATDGPDAPGTNPTDGPVPWEEIDLLDSVALPDFPIDASARSSPPMGTGGIPRDSDPARSGWPTLAGRSGRNHRQRVSVQPRPGWIEPANLFTAILLEPGNRKSAVFSDAVRPLREIESELIEQARPMVAIKQSHRRQLDSTLKRLEKAAANGDQAARHEAETVAAELAISPEPALPRLVCDDSTVEKLAMMLSVHGGRMASMSAEGTVFDLMAGQYSKKGECQFGVYLMGHAGDDLIIDRVCRESVTVHRPALTCAYAIQPAVISGIAGDAAFRGRGLLARFFYAAPRSWIGSREIGATPMTTSTTDVYREIIRTLSTLEGATTLRLTDQAASDLLSWEREIERMLADGGEMESIRDWGTKLAGATLRMAAAIHCVRHRGPVGKIDPDTLGSAIRIARYAIPHALHVLGQMGATGDDDADARYILKWIKENDLRDFTRRDACQHGRQRFRHADDIDPALALLTDRRYIRLFPELLNKPGRPSPRYEINPAFFQTPTRPQYAQYTQNPSQIRQKS